MTEAEHKAWMAKMFGDPVEVPLSLLRNKKISWGAKGLYISILASDNPSVINPKDYVRPTDTLKKVLRWLRELRSWGYLPDGVAHNE